MTYISPRESPYGEPFVRYYIRYIIIVAHGKSCALHAYAYTPPPPPPPVRIPVVLSSLRAGSSRSFSLRSPLVLVVIHHPPASSPILSRSIARGVLRAFFRRSSPRASSSSPPRPPPPPAHVPSRAERAGLRFPASCATTVNHSACDCVRLITVIRLLLVPVYRTLIIIIDLARTSFPCFHATSARARTFVRCMAPRMYDRTDGLSVAASVEPGKTCHSAAYTRDPWRFTVTEARYVAKRRGLDERSRSAANAAELGERTTRACNIRRRCVSNPETFPRAGLVAAKQLTRFATRTSLFIRSYNSSLN